jgi:tRNA(Ile2)-agmatinylcytidine synthase
VTDVLLAVDDTDAPDGMCTTYLARLLPDALEAPLARRPRLVRLHPAAPWKTRGNGAVVLPLETDRDPQAIVDEAAPLVEDRAAPSASPALAASEAPLDAQTYLRGVRELLDPDWGRARLEAGDAAAAAPGGDRALVGCAAALGWRPRDPDRPASWTLLAHRRPERWDEPRDVPQERIRALAEEEPALFDNLDRDVDLACVPASPGPVLYGLRAASPAPLREARQDLPTPEGVTLTLFATNQASDDHLVRRAVADLEPNVGAVVRGRVADDPWRDEAGHVFAPLDGENGARIRLAAFEPTKAFRHAVTALAPGDRIEAHGLVRPGPDEPALHLGRMRVLQAPPRQETAANPACPGCGSRMGSAGADAGYRCRDCGTEAPEEAAEARTRERDLEPGWYEVPPEARRHLARPARLLEGPVHDPAKAYNPARSIPQR